jgi:serine phosphatase RsbU (regulator of sigma subunit)
MAAIKLKKLLRKNEPAYAVVLDLIAALGQPAAVQDVDGTVLLGAPLEQRDGQTAIEHEGSILGWVSGPQPQSGVVARLLAEMAAREAEKRALAGDLLDKYRELNLLYDLSEQLVATPQPESIAAMTLNEASRLIQTTVGWVMLLDEATQTLQVIGHYGAPVELKGEPGQIDLVTAVIASREGQILNDVPAHKVLADRRLESCAFLCVPLKTEQRVLGAILLLGVPPIAYTAHDLKLLNTVALQAGPAIEMARLYQIAVVKGRMERELQLAYQVQASLIPQELPQLARWEFAGRWLPARELSGDYYDVIHEPDGHLGLVIGDVADKGMPSALFMVFVRSAVRSAVDQGHTPAETIARANRLVAQESTNGLFVTLVYARLEPAAGWLAYVNAGHNPPLHYRAAIGELTEMAGSGIPLGILAEMPYAERQTQLQPGDFVVFYTDGVTEAMNAANEEFGMARLRQAILAASDRSAEELTAAIQAAVQDFARSTPPFDDLTLMVVRRLPGD